MRKLNAREKTLLGILLVMLIVSSYVMLFKMPINDEINQLNEQIKADKELIEQMDVKLSDKHRMESVLDEIFSKNTNPISMPIYDNVTNVMFELNRILAQSEQYSLSFQSVDPSSEIIERNVSLPFSCSSYEVAYSILDQLDKSNLRCMIDDLSVQTGGEGTVSVSANITFFEYCENPISNSDEQQIEQ